MSHVVGVFLINLSSAVLLKLALFVGLVMLLGLLLKRLKQPYIVAYIFAGLILGPHATGFISSEDMVNEMGSFGLILLMFFIGMEISLEKLIEGWRISVIGTLIQVILSIGAVAIFGFWFDWPIYRIIFLGFVISLSSTAVVIKVLQNRAELQTPVGQKVLGVILAQDVIIVPMLIIVSYMNGEAPDTQMLLKQVVGGILLVAFVWWMMWHQNAVFPFDKYLRIDHEVQVFVAIFICLSFSFISAAFELSAALGAFIAGIFISTARATQWVHDSLHSFRVLFVALFFISVGMLIDIDFVLENYLTIGFFVGIIFVTNNLINTTIFRAFGRSWQSSLYGGAILAQIGEFSFVLGEAGFRIGLITDYTHQLVISIIAFSLIISPFWVSIMAYFTHDRLSHKLL